MSPFVRSGLAAFVLACACARAGPFSAARERAETARLGEPRDASLDPREEDGARAFRVELPAAGGLRLTLRPDDPQAGLEALLFDSSGAQVPLAGRADAPEAAGLSAGAYFLLVRDPARRGRPATFRLTPLYLPSDPDGAKQPCSSRETALPLTTDRRPVEGVVDYSARRRTCFYRLRLAAPSTLGVRLDPRGANIGAELLSPSGPPRSIDSAAGLTRQDAPAGDYYVRVYAVEPGDAGSFSLRASIAGEGPCGPDAAPWCAPAGAEELRLPADSREGAVGYAQGSGLHFYRLHLKEKGRLTIGFHVTRPQRGSRASAWFVRGESGDGERLFGPSSTKEIDGPGDVLLRVQAAEKDEAAAYTLAVTFQPDDSVAADVVEWGRAPCVLTVEAGADQGVRPGAFCVIVNQAGQAVDTGVVEQVFPRLSKVRPSNPACRQTKNARALISPR